MKKTAILHDYMDELGGAEISLLTLAQQLSIPIYTTNVDKTRIKQLGYGDVEINSIGAVSCSKHLKQIQTQLLFHRLKLEGFEKHIYAGSYSIHAAANHKRNLWFCISPLRGLYDLRYRTCSPLNLPKQAVKEFQILLDKKAVEAVDKIIATSKNVQQRIRKTYGRKSTLIYYPLETKKYFYRPHADYWLSVSRIDPYKRIELQLEAFRKMPKEKLVVVGGAAENLEGYLRALEQKAPANVEFIEAVYDKQKLTNIYSRCKGLIATAEDEDFGITCIEAMASGKPVIAPNEGGYRETVVSGETGVLIDDVSPGKIREAVEDLGDTSAYRSECVRRAEEFDVHVFTEKMRGELQLL
ncbi:MAG: glycosyltransferase [Candidatus Altiarchaeales archaeon]|nr:glycosyltransferase [Candidatus Altiarchaeales archaeon]